MVTTPDHDGGSVASVARPAATVSTSRPASAAGQGRRPGAWRAGFVSLETETPEAVELEVQGTLPPDLAGTLYRIGPARLDVYGRRYRHWFDGDGMVHALALSEGRVTYRNRFVATDKKREEDAARRPLHAGFGTPPPGSPMQRLRHARPKSAANTNVVLHAGRLLALWEAGPPWRLDPVTLETIGEDHLGGALPPHGALSAHPKLDPATGEMWNFGVDVGPRVTVSLYRTTSAGVTERTARIPLPVAAMVHDFAITPTRAVLVVPPMAVPRLPLGLLTGHRSVADSIRWRPADGTLVLVVDRASGEVRRYRTEPFLVFHTVNAFDDGDDVVVDVCAFADDAVMRMFGDVMAGRADPLPNPPHPERLRLRADGAVDRRRLSDAILEFPRVAGRSFAAEHRRVYGVGQQPDDDFLAVPTVVDVETGTATVAPLAPGQFAGELVPVGKRGAAGDDDVWLLTMVLDADAGSSQLWILDGADIAAPPVARVALPHLVPFGFHGNFVRGEPVPT